MSTTTTEIAWTDRTWNPVRGCSRISPGCGGASGVGGCYAEKVAGRFSGPGLPYEGLATIGKQGARWTGVVKLIPDALAEPLRWKKPARIFVNSMSDLFHEGLRDEEIAAVFGVMAACPQHTFQVLTKRAERMARWFEWAAKQGADSDSIWTPLMREAVARVPDRIGMQLQEDGIARDGMPTMEPWPLPNVWIGVSVEDQPRADERIQYLRMVPAAVRFLSVEPQLGDVSIRRAVASRTAMDDGCGIHWCIIGGESGPGARPFDVAWARSLLAECRKWRIAAFVKQLGAKPVCSGGDGFRICRLCGPVTHGQPLRDRKGGDPSEWPADLRVRDFPTVQR